MRHVPRPRRLDEDQRLVWKAYRDVFHGLSSTLEAQLLRDAGLSGSEYAVLVALSHAPGGALRPRELCTELGWDRSRLSHLVGRMEARHLIVREQCAEDARGSLVRLSKTGRAAVDDAAPEHSEAIRRYFFDVLSDADIACLTRVMERLHDNLRHT